MGVIRGSLFVIACVLLFILLVASNAFLTIDRSLDYNVVKPELTNLLTNLADRTINLSEQIEKTIPAMLIICKNESNFIFDSEEGEQVTIPCNVVSEGSDAIIKYSFGNLIDEAYNKKYDCEYWTCFKELEGTEGLYFAVSKQAQDYWAGKFYLSLLGILILVGVMFLLIETRTTLPIVVGALMIVASLPFAKLETIVGWFAKLEILQFLTVFFTKSVSVFWTGFILGLILVGIGVILKIFKIGFKIGEFFSKFKKEKVVVKDTTKLKE